jgi:DNA-binding NarL/FixJ family response regulator
VSAPNPEPFLVAEGQPPLLPIKVLIGEAREMAADTMIRAVNRAHGLSVSGRCASRSEVSTSCAIDPPAVAVLDLGLYDGDACLAVTSVREHVALARVLLLAPELEVEQLARAVIAGAENCISDRVDRRAFVLAIRATAAGRSVAGQRLEQGVARLVFELQENDNRRLSPREIDVLRLASMGLCVTDIAARLFISANTARTHLQHTYRKLGVKNRGGAVATAIRTGMLR